MLSAESIRAMSREAASKAAQEGIRPFIVEEEDLDAWRANPYSGFPFPYIGEHVPSGYKRTANCYFVDSSGLGAPDESAFTAEQFTEKLRSGYGYAITEAGQFQVYVQEYEVLKRSRY